jgi:hypothetical protein
LPAPSAEVQPVEIASAIRRAMDDRASHAGRGRAIVPNVFTIELSDTDHDRLTDDPEVAEELVVAAEEHVASQHYTAGGSIRISLTNGGDLETGVFRVRPLDRPPPEADSPSPSTTGMPRHRTTWTRTTTTASRHHRVRPCGASPKQPPSSQGARQRPPLPHRRWPPLPAHGRHQRPGPRRRRRHHPRRPRRRPSAQRDPGQHRRATFVALIRDLGSTNGTFVNGERVDSEHLRDGDQVTIGRTSMTYRGPSVRQANSP